MCVCVYLYVFYTLGRCLLCLLDIATCPLAPFTQELEICSTLLYPLKMPNHLLFREDGGGGGGGDKLEYEGLSSVPSTHKKGQMVCQSQSQGSESQDPGGSLGA